MQNRADILLEYIKYVLTQKSKYSFPKEVIIHHLMEHGLSENEIKFILEAANVE